MGSVRMTRKNAVDMKELMTQFLKSSGLVRGLNTQRIYAAWDDVSGAAKFTVKKFYREGKLYITLDSSVVRSQLYFQKDVLLGKINEALNKDMLYTREDSSPVVVNELILK